MFICLNLRTLPLTETEERLIAAAAMMGESKMVKNGKHFLNYG